MKLSLTLKRILSLILVLSIVFALLSTTGCKKKKDNDETPEQTEDKPKDGSVGRNEFIDDIGGVSETYVGAVSKETYPTSTAAAAAFVTEEIAGNSAVTVLETESKGELNNSEISRLGIPTEDQEGILGVEKLEVTYSVASTVAHRYGRARATTAEQLNKSHKVVVYVIKYENNWKYFSPAPVTGDTITKSYYDSVFNYEKYKNCTFKSENVINAVVNAQQGGQTETMNVEIKITQLIKHADGKVYLEQKIESNEFGQYTNSSIYAYLEEVDGMVVCYVKTSDTGDWYETYLSTIGFSSLNELTPFYDQYLDYTYFNKADYGFVLENENAAQYVREALSGVPGLDSLISGDSLDIDMFAEYYVSDGVLSGMRMDAEIIIDMSVEGISMHMVETVIGTLSCTDYGTTVVEKPFSE